MNNNWNEQNSNTVRAWKNYTLKSIIIYNSVLTKYNKRSSTVSIFVLFMGYLATLISSITTAVSAISKQYIWIIFGLSVSLFVINGLMSFFQSVIKLKNWNEIEKKYMVYIAKLDNFYDVISNILILPEELRIDAIEFIKEQNNAYLMICKESPILSNEDSKYGMEQYKQFLQNNENNYAMETKYKNRDDVVFTI